MPKYDCVRGLKIEAKSAVYNEVIYKGIIHDIKPVPGSVANRFEIRMGTVIKMIILDRVDINRLSELKECRSIDIFNRADMIILNFRK